MLTKRKGDLADAERARLERERIRELFLLLDTDHSNALERSEFVELSRTLGKPLTDARIDAAMREMDRDGDGQVGFEEFCGACTQQPARSAGSIVPGGPRPTETPVRVAEWWQINGQISKVDGRNSMLSEATARKFIYDVPMFQGLVEPAFIAALAKRLHPLSANPGDLVISKGDEAEAMYFVVHGLAEALYDLSRPPIGRIGARLAAHTSIDRAWPLIVNVGTGPGQFFGEQALLTDAPRNAFVRATAEMELLVRSWRLPAFSNQLCGVGGSCFTSLSSPKVLEKADLTRVLADFPDLRDLVLEPTSVPQPR